MSGMWAVTTLIVLAATILARRKGDYDILEAANKKNEITA
jgi:hypothetical protein